MADAENQDEVLDYDDEEAEVGTTEVATDKGQKAGASYVSIHSSGFRDFLLKPELLRAIVDCGFEHPSLVQHNCIPQAIVGTDVVCQAKSGMGKTAVFVLATLQQLAPVDGEIHVLVMCHARELAYQIRKEYDRFRKYMDGVTTEVFFGGMKITEDHKKLENGGPTVAVGTPGRLLALIRTKKMDLSHLKHFVLDECDKMLEQEDMRGDVQEIFMSTPHEKQVMMFSATLKPEIRPVCKKFMQDQVEIYVDDETKLSLDGLVQYYKEIPEDAKNRTLIDFLDKYDFNQVVIFVKSVSRCKALTRLMVDENFPATYICAGLKQEERLKRYSEFKNFEKRILVATDLFGRGMDIERVNMVINYDMTEDSDSYLHRVARAGRFGTKGLAVSFLATEEDKKVLEKVQERFEVDIPTLPEEIDTSVYTEA